MTPGRLRRSRYLREVGTLSAGTALAQAIPIAVSPLLTRLYSPEEFGLVAVYLAGAAVLVVLATGRYEFAIPLPEDDLDAANLVALSLKVCAGVSAAVLLAAVLLGDQIAGWLGNPALAPWLLLFPVTIMAKGVFTTFQYWCNRTSQYAMMARNRVTNSVAAEGGNIGFGVGGVGGGMVLGTTLGHTVAAAWISWRVWLQQRDLFSLVGRAGQREMARRYSSHPKHLVPSHLIGTVAQQIPIFLISSVFSLAVAGFFSLAYRLVSMPTGLVASAIGDVYRQKVAVRYNEAGEFRKLFRNTLGTTTLMALLPFGVLYLIAPDLFGLVFGEEWRVAGEYAQILVVASFFQFIFTPVDKGALVVGATRYIFFWQVARLLLFGGLLWVGVTQPVTVEAILWGFVAINASLYVVDGIYEYRLAGGSA